MSSMRTLGSGVAALLVSFCAVLGEQPAAAHYRIEARGSELSWELPATLHTVHGNAPELDGTVDAEPGPGGLWRISSRIVVQAGKMVTGNASRDRTMREKTLETGRFPEIVFEARRIVADMSRFKPGERFTVEVTGDLAVHGKAVLIQLPVDVEVTPGRVVLVGSFALNWRQFGLEDPSFGVIRVREPMKVSFRLVAVPAAD